jgi:ankyrin repeat protein
MIKVNMKIYVYTLISIALLASCSRGKPAFRFSNFKGTKAETIAKAIEKNDITAIEQEVKLKQVDVNFKDKKYEVSLLTLAMMNDKRKSFKKLLELGANPNIENSYCVGSLNAAIRYNNNCDTYYIEMLLDYGAKISPQFFKKCNSYYTYDPIVETIMYHYEEDKIDCQFKILKILTSRLNDTDLLFKYNDSINYRQNIVFRGLSTHKNIPALKYFIVDLKYKVPEKIFIDGTVLLGENGYKDLKEILQNKVFMFENSEYREKAKQEILAYLEK